MDLFFSNSRRIFFLIIACAFINVSSFSNLLAQISSPKREFRGAWLHVVGNQTIKTMLTDEVKAMFIKTLDSLLLSGCNAVIFQVRPQADAFYDSKIEPWSRFLTGEQGIAPVPYWDPLKFMIDEAHKRGMELHAWCNPYRVTSNDEEILSKDHLFYKNPKIFVRYGKQLYFDPGEPESRRHVVKVISDIVKRYNVDAIHFDDYFYPYPIKGEEFNDNLSFKKYAKNQGFKSWQRGDWRRNNVELLIKEINDSIKSIKPWVRFGISPFGIHRNLKDTPDGSGSNTNGLSNYDALFADVPAWANKGYIDYIAPQLYWKIGHPAADYETLIKWWDKSNFKGQLYIGQNIDTFKESDIDNPKTTQFGEKMRLVRVLENVDGNVWWPGWIIQKNPFGFADSLITKYQSNIALIPAYADIDSIAPSAVTSITKIGKKIEWTTDELENEDPMQKVLFFAIYCFPQGIEPDISKSGYLIKITPDNYFKISNNFKHHNKGCNIVVTVIDRCWNESAPSKVLNIK